jgi:glycosyltransferase involved in cell wall biosynthesis
MRILFLDQSGELGGAELFLADVAKDYQDLCLVGLFADGPFRKLLEQNEIPVQVLAKQAIQVRKDSNLLQNLSNVSAILPLMLRVATIARDYDVIYANTQKAFVIGALASFLAGRPLVYHLHDIISEDHFSLTNRRVMVSLAKRFARLIIANSEATKTAFIEAGGREDITHVVYNGFDLNHYRSAASDVASIRQAFNWDDRFIVGHFSRLSPWKGQHVLLNALVHCPKHVVAVFVGDALFGEQAYVESLHQQVAALGLEERVRFLGFRSDVVSLMSACDLIAHTSTAPEPFGRVIVEAMLCRKPVVAAAAGGAIELIRMGETGWLVPPANPQKLAEIIHLCQSQPQQVAKVVQTAQAEAQKRFDLSTTNQQIHQLLNQLFLTRA